MLILNIGLHSRYDDPKDKTLRESLRLAALYRRFIDAGEFIVQTSNTEPTAVVSVEDDWFGMAPMGELADEFQQDAIAIYDTDTRKGCLVGPRSFNLTFMREFFVLPSGQRLSEVPYL